MANDTNPPTRPARRGFLKAGGAAVAAGASLSATGVAHAARSKSPAHAVDPYLAVEPFFGEHQGGIVTPQQSHIYVAALDLTTTRREDVIGLLRTWTDSAARMTQGQPAGALPGADGKAAPDSGDVLGLGAAGLTVTFGFGPGLFTSDGKDRYGIANRRPAALVDLPRFNGDQLLPEKTGGDLFIQACANDAQVAFHAVRQLARQSYGIATMRWGQAGFVSGPRGQTPRNLMGFKDGTNNPSTKKPELMNQFVWANGVDAPWMQGGSYGVVRRIRITLEHWDLTEADFQEQVFGRHKYSGAPIGKKNEFLHRALAAMAPGNRVRHRADFHRLPGRPACRLYPHQREALKVRHDEPVHDARRQRGVRLPAGRETGFVHRRGAIRNVRHERRTRGAHAADLA